MSDPVTRLREALAGTYEIDREIGRGGMATVYLARDLKHHREVAVKVLNADIGAILGVERFLSEIRVTAKLQHPNLLPLFDSGDAAGQLFYVMPYVDGESLRSRLDREKQLPVSEAVRIAAAVAGALDYAHRQSIIHRDLKPENILLHDGQPIVADFGIALAVSRAGGQRVTQTGLSLGTPQYMSPEQATGDRTLDARSDIYALGAVTYEMLTGDPPHAGSNAQAILAKVLTEKPVPIRALRETVPAHVAHAVDRALAKVPADRWASAREFVDALEGRITVAAEATGGAVPTWQRWLPWVTTAALTAACLALLVRPRAQTSPRNATMSQFAISSVGDDRARIEDASIAPDGQTIAIAARTAGTTAIWIRRLDDATARRLAGSDGGVTPFFSPDSRSIGFVGADGFVRRLPLEGGTPTTLAKMPKPTGIVWATPDTIIGGMLEMTRTFGLSRISATGSTGGSLTMPTDRAMHHGPILAPDGRSVIFSSIVDDSVVQPGIVSLATGRSSTLTIPGTRFALPFGVIDDAVLYRDSAGGVWSVPVDFQSQRVSAPPVGLDVSRRLRDVAELRLARNGTLIYTRNDDRRVLMIGIETSDPDTILLDPTLSAGAQVPRWSPDGQAVAMLSIGSEPGVFLVDRASRTTTRLTTWRSDLPPVWSADGTRVITGRLETADTVAWWVWRDGRAAPDRVASAAVGWSIIECAPSPDQRFVAMELQRGDRRAIFVSPAGGGPSDAILVVENGRSPRWSPDGHWIAHEADVAGKSQIFAQRYPSGGRVQISDAGATHPVWARTGTDMYFESGQDIVRARLEATPGGLRVLRRERVWGSNRSSERGDAPYTDYDVSASGQLAVFGPAGTGRSEVVVELNWLANVRRR